jgi:hypothetical protein
MAVEGLSIRLYLDQNAHQRLATDARREGYDVVTAREIGLAFAEDEEHLRWAADHGRVVLTHDLHDFRRLATSWFLDGKVHAGIIISVQPGQPPRGVPYATLLRRLLNLLETLAADDMLNRVEWLDRRWSDSG